jgi:hypothetical protein
MLSFYVQYSPSALFFSSEHDKTISVAGAAGLINRKYLQSTTISDAGSENRNYTLDLICPHPCRFVLIDQLSDLIAARRIAETGHERDKFMSLGIKTS